MALLGTLSVQLNADTAKLAAGLKQAGSKLSSFVSMTTRMSGKFMSAYRGMNKFMSESVEAAEIQRNAQILLSSAIQGTSQAIDQSKIEKLASELQKVTVFGDEATISAASMLVGYQLTEDQVLKMIPRMQNLATVMGTDLNSAARGIGEVLANGSARFRTLRIVASDAEKALFDAGTETQRTAMLMELLDRRTGDAAKAMADTGFGAVKQFSGALGDLKEQFGFMQEPFLKLFFGDMAKGTSWLTEEIKKLSPETKKAGMFLFMMGKLAMGALGAVGLMAGAQGVPALTKALHAMIGALRASAALLGKMAMAAAAVTFVSGLAGQFGALAGGGAEGLREKIGVTGDEGPVAILGAILKDAFLTGANPITDAMSGLLATLDDPKLGEAQDNAAKAMDNLVVSTNSAAKAIEKGFDFGGGGSEGPIDFDKALGIEGEGFDFAGEKSVSGMGVGPSSAYGGTSGADSGLAALEIGATMFDQAAKQAAPKLMMAADTFASTMSATGNPMMAAIATIGALILSTEGFGRIMAVLEGVIESVMGVLEMFIAPVAEMVEAIKPVLDAVFTAFMPVFEFFSGVLGSVAGFLREIADLLLMFTPVLDLVAIYFRISYAGLALLEPALELFGEVVGFIAGIIAKIVNMIVRVINKLIDAIASFVKKIPFKGDDWARDIRKWKLAEVEAGQGAEESWIKTTEVAEETTDAMAKAAAILNAPNGFKYSLERYNAILRDGAEMPSSRGYGSAASSLEGGRQGIGGNAPYIANANIIANNPEDLVRAILDEQARTDTLRDNGSRSSRRRRSGFSGVGSTPIGV